MSNKARLFNQHTYDAFEEHEASTDVEVEASETTQSVTNLANSLFSSTSVPVTKNDLEDLL